jgi:sensor c-di-GMP phosphodiesterase-like protein
MVRIRKANGVGTGLAALMPIEQLIVFLSSQGTPLNSHARMSTRAGVVIGESGAPPQDSESRVTASLSSQRYGLHVTKSLPRANPSSNRADMRTIGAVASGTLAILLFGFLIAFRMLLPKRQADNPIAELERALQAGEFVPYFQPVVDIRSGRLRGAEVLMRWRKPDGSVVPPVSFIPLAESSGLIVEMTRALMRRVCDEAGSAFGRRPHLKVGFNLTARHFADEEIVRDVRDIFSDSPIRLSQVVLEVTERQPLDNLTDTRRVIAALQGLGVRIAIDDVGTGHSGLSYMLKLGVDIIKIDKMFVDAIGTERYSQTIIETLVELARTMNMEVIAEGVERIEQVEYLRRKGVCEAQGYVFAPPLPVNSYLALVDAMDRPNAGASAEPAIAASAA